MCARVIIISSFVILKKVFKKLASDFFQVLIVHIFVGVGLVGLGSPMMVLPTPIEFGLITQRKFKFTKKSHYILF